MISKGVSGVTVSVFGQSLLHVVYFGEDHCGSIPRIEMATLRLAEDPYRRSSIDYGLRYWSISRFPFVVFSDVREFEIPVLVVMHTAQEHEAWLRPSAYS